MTSSSLLVAPQQFSTFAKTIIDHKYAHDKGTDGKESWEDIAHRVVNFVVAPLMPAYADDIEQLIIQRKFIPGGRYLYSSGRPFSQLNNCLLMSVEDSREGWAELLHNATMALTTGAGIGIDYSKVREEGALIRGMGGRATGPISLMKIVNEAGRGIQQGGSRRSAIWAGLRWDHPDIFKFIELKNWSPEVRAMKEKDFNFPAAMDGTNISVLLNDEFFLAYQNASHPKHGLARDIYWKTIRQAMKTGEPGFSIDVGKNAGETLRNACTEVSSHDDSDICNLGSLNLARIDSLSELDQVVDLATLFLICGSIRSRVPYDKVLAVREKNRRLGLGMMGMHEWLLMRGKRYGMDSELEQWLQVYSTSTEKSHAWADRLSVSRPVKTRAIAPSGTISIAAETTSGIEPIFCTAFKRRYLKGNTWHAQYVVDATAQRLIDRGVDPSSIEDAYDLARNVERRIKFQAFVQKYTDMGISSTTNIPSWGSEYNNSSLVGHFGDTLMTYLPQLRGITFYPDGARGGQPLTPVPYDEAADQVGVEFVEYGNERSCVNGVCGL